MREAPSGQINENAENPHVSIKNVITQPLEGYKHFVAAISLGAARIDCLNSRDDGGEVQASKSGRAALSDLPSEHYK
jgi:hypothetical protein